MSLDFFLRMLFGATTVTSPIEGAPLDQALQQDTTVTAGQQQKNEFIKLDFGYYLGDTHIGYLKNYLDHYRKEWGLSLIGVTRKKTEPNTNSTDDTHYIETIMEGHGLKVTIKDIKLSAELIMEQLNLFKAGEIKPELLRGLVGGYTGTTYKNEKVQELYKVAHQQTHHK